MVHVPLLRTVVNQLEFGVSMVGGCFYIAHEPLSSIETRPISNPNWFELQPLLSSWQVSCCSSFFAIYVVIFPYNFIILPKCSLYINVASTVE